MKFILRRIIFFQKKVFLIFQEMEPSSLKDKTLQEGTIWARKTLEKTHAEKIFYFWGNENF